jgi:hypothetical protein
MENRLALDLSALRIPKKNCVPHDKMEEQDLLQQLKDTPFACSSLSRLSGGSANYVYRGILIDAIPTRDESWNMKSVIVKYSLGHIPGNSGFKLDLFRCVCLHFIFFPTKVKEPMSIS